MGEINKRDDIDFVIHGGDMSDFGVTDEFLWQRDIMNKLRVPHVALIGNHDCLGTGEETYRAVFGDPNFIHCRTGEVCMPQHQRYGFDYSRPIPDFTFLEKSLPTARDRFDKTVVSMHVRPYADQFNNNVARVFHRYVTDFPGIQFCTAAHEHHVFEENLFEDGIMYYMSDCMKNRNYYVFTITPKDMSAKWSISNLPALAAICLLLLWCSPLSRTGTGYGDYRKARYRLPATQTRHRRYRPYTPQPITTGACTTTANGGKL